MVVLGICDDEKHYRSIIRKYLEEILKSNAQSYEIHEFTSGEELLENYPNNLDILILDIQMDSIDGMNTARRIRTFDSNVEIIFMTSYSEFMQEGYEVRAYRYLLKPIDSEGLKKHILACIKEIRKNKNQYILIKNKSNTYKIYSNEIKYIEVQKKDMIIHTINKDFDARYSLEKIEKDLNTEQFVRCHKSFIINLNYVENIKSNTAILSSEEEIPISRYRYKDIKEKFLKFLGDRIC